MSSKRTLKTYVKQGLRRAFEVGQVLGVDVLPRHFYSEVPDIRVLRQDDHWKRPFSMAGVSGTELESQLDFVRAQCTPEVIDAIEAEPVHALACAENGEPGYGPIEADFLYAFVRTQQPAQIVQIGCGVSTALCLLAADDAGAAYLIYGGGF